VIERAALASARAGAAGDAVGVVKAHQPLAVTVVKGERIVKAMWLRFRHGNAPRPKLNPKSGFRINNEDLSIQSEKRIEGGVTFHII